MTFKTKVKTFLAPHARKVCLALPGAIALVGGASAEVINTTQITEIFTDLTTIFPSIGTFVIGVLPTLLMLAIVGFILKFFDKILSIFDRVF